MPESAPGSFKDKVTIRNHSYYTRSNSGVAQQKRFLVIVLF